MKLKLYFLSEWVLLTVLVVLCEQEKQTQQAVLECAELRAQVFALRSENSQALGEVRSKEEQIHQLSRDLHNLVCNIVLAYTKYVACNL